MTATDNLVLTTPIRVLGVDPGLNITGYGVLEVTPAGPKLCEAGVIRGKTRGSLTKRLLEIHTGLCEVIQALKPTVMSLEQLYSHYDRPRTSILMGHARGVICLAAEQAGIEVVHYSATQIKKILTGNGHAPKSQMQQAVQRELRLDVVPEPADVADALAIALCHYYLSKQARLMGGQQILAAAPRRPNRKSKSPVDDDDQTFDENFAE